MGKRKNDYFRDSRSNYYGKKKKYEMRKQSSGVLITLGTSFRINEGCLEFFNILESQAPFLFTLPNNVTAINKTSQDSTHSSSSSSSSSSTAATISDKVQYELNEIKQSSTALERFDQLVKGVSFFKFDMNSPKSPNDTIYDILQHLKTTIPLGLSSTCTETPLSNKLQLSCRFVHRVLPIDITCSPHPINIYRAAQQLIKDYFPESAVTLAPHEFLNDITKTKPFEENSRDQNHIHTFNATTKDKADQMCKDKADQMCKDKADQMCKDKADQMCKDKADQMCKDKADQMCNDQEDPICNATESKEYPFLLPFTPTFTVPVNATWSLVIERRGGMKTIEREDLISKIGAYVGTNYKVNLSQPQYTLLVQIVPAFCGLSVLRSYNDLAHYNLHRLCHPDLYPPQNSNI